MKEACFEESSLNGVVFDRANLSYAIFSKTNLKETRFQNTYLFRTIFKQVEDLSPQKIKSSYCWEDAIFDSDFLETLNQEPEQEVDNDRWRRQYEEDIYEEGLKASLWYDDNDYIDYVIDYIDE